MHTKKNRPQIIATLGPAVKNRIYDLVRAGCTGFRLNCSHITQQELTFWLAEIERVILTVGTAMPVWLDLQGTKMRIGRLTKPIMLQKGQNISFRHADSQIQQEIPLPHETAFEHIETGDLILLNDGKIELSVLKQGDDFFTTKVITPGELSSCKGFAMKKCSTSSTEVSSRDRAFIEQTRRLDYIGYAVSYLQSEEDLWPFRHIIDGRPVAAKIERKKAFDSLVEIAAISDTLWLCRGDLAAGDSIYDLYSYEKAFIHQMVSIGKPSFIAGQVLEHMVKETYPSRSEVAHLGFLLEHGFSGLVLSDETAIGAFPVKAVEFCSDYFEHLKS